MTESATLTRAEQRRLETSSRLSSVSRRLTAARGLSGFTIEEVCDEVGVSRRTFFNYFPSKEQAVLGVDEAEETRALGEVFLARGSRGWPDVIDDLVDIVSGYVTSAGLSVEDHLEVMAAVEREPKLLARFIGMGKEREGQILALIATREGVGVDDTRARAAVDVLGTLMRSAAGRLLEPNGAENFGSALTESLTALRAVLNP
ncbi:TetR/AcrR family transcriptional regulator [Glaciihabitans arcticus]|uniref:TetR/AcrR family transcriptional regulator n=1 Tax=Glaciihabitans arcticus TaxID=2668039 RepID=A0A4Q9GYR0_9MICO|nr:TetR/AcrR family transcriptional regulator [Glaciihabitans arcticus]TBN58397.1 TetR/AcrR family transcriptional regulator [Glaciihabitans arcticus]